MGSGGMRVGAGRPPKPLEDKLLDGDIKNKNEVMVTSSVYDEVSDNTTPEPPEFFNDLHRPEWPADRQDPRTNEFIKIFKWVKQMGCDKVVPRQLLEQYANNRVHWIEVQKLLAKTSYVYTKDGKVKINPLVTEYIAIEKAMNNTFMLINAKVRENCANGYFEYRRDDDIMRELID